MKVLIVGAAGFVGHYLIKQLAESGWDVCATCLEGEAIEAEIPVYRLDILDNEATASVIGSAAPDVLIHLAAQSSVALSWKNPSLTIDVNVKGAVHVLDAVRDGKRPCRVLLIGSSEMYGPVPPEENPISELQSFSPGNIYAATKAAQDAIGNIYAKAYGMDIIRIRAFNHFGPKQSPQFVVADFCRQIAMIEKDLAAPVVYVGNLAAKRDFTDVRDVVRAYELLCLKGLGGETYNVGSGHAVSIQAILDTALSFANCKIKIEIDENKFRPIEVPISEADISKLIATTGWAPAYRFEETIRETLDDWRAAV